MDDNYLASQIFGSAKRLALFVALVAVFLNIGVGVAWLALARIERQKPNFVASQANLPASTDQNSPIGIQSQKLTVNAQLQVNGQFYLAPSTLPADAKAGTIVFDQNTNTLQYYNGTTFSAVATQASIPQAAVASVQGQTGAISFVPGTGIAINGTTISGSGILGVNGVGGTINVTTANGIASLSLPQNIAPSATPTFAGITLSGITVTEFEGRGLDSSSGILGVRLQALNQGGLQLDGSGNLSLLTSCNPSDILKFIANAWVCDQDQGGASSPSLQGAYNNYGGVVQAIINLNDNQKGIRIRDSASPITASSLFAIQSSAGTNYLDVTPTTTTVGTDLVVTSGNDFTVNGAVSINTTTGGTTIGNSSSNFQLDSNALDVSTAGALSGITGYSQASGNFGITGTGTFTTGTGAIALQGTVTVGTGSAAGRLLLTDGSGNTATLRTAGGSLAQSTTYSLPSVAGALNNTASVCVLYGGGGSNCFGAGGGIAGTGTPNQIPLFDTAGSIADSSLTDVSGAVTGTGSLSIQGSGGISVGNTSTRGLLRFNDANAANNYVGIQGPATTTGYTLTLPTGPAAAAGYCLKDNDGAGGLVWGACLGASGPTPDLAGVYAASTTGGVLASVTLNSTSQGIYLKDAATPISGDLFNVQSNNGVTKYLAVTPTSTTVQNFTVTTGRTLTVNGDAITDLTGNGLEVNTNALSIKLNEATLGYSGLNLSSSGVKLKDCSDQQVLKFITATSWTCAADNGSGPGINLQEAYTNFTGPDDATITIDTSSLGLRIRDTSTPQGVSAPVFAVQNNNSSSNYLFVNSTNFNVGVATSTFSGNATIQGGTLSLGTASVAGSLFLHNASTGANGITLSAGGSSNYSLILPAGAGSANNCLKKDPSNTTQLVWDACLGGNGGGGGDVLNGGNTVTATMILGTDTGSNYALGFETNGVTRATFDNNYFDETNGFNLQSLTFLEDYGIRGGAGTSGKSLTVQGGFGNTYGSGNAGFLTLAGGDGYNGAGDVYIRGGNSYGGIQRGRDVSINGGCQMASGEYPYCPGDNTTAGRIYIGTNLANSVNLGGNAINLQPAGSGNIVIGSVNGTANLLVLDTKNTTGDPTGVNGGMYYNSADGKFRCFQNTGWTDCISGIGGDVLQNGNSFGVAMTLGTDDSNTLSFETGGTTRLTIGTTGNISLQQTTTIQPVGVTSTTGYGLTIAAGDTTGSGTAGSLTLRAGDGTGSAGGTLNINNASSSIFVPGAINIGTNSVPGANINIGTSTNSGSINIGSSTSLKDINLQTTAVINIGTLGGSVNLGSVGGGSPTATVIQGGTGNISLRTTGNIVLGTPDTTGTLLVQDTKTSAGDPTGVNGGSYYNSSTSTFRCFEGGAWKNCSGAPEWSTPIAQGFGCCGIRAITYANGLFFAITSSNNYVHTSTDGKNWVLATISNLYQAASVTYGNGIYVVVGESGSTNIAYSSNAINWTSIVGPTNEWGSVTYGNGLFVAVADTGVGNRVMTSPDGINWTLRTSAADNDWTSVTYGNGLFVAVADTGVGNRVMTSPDGINWTLRTSAADNGWTSVTYGNGLFVAVANTGVGNRVMTSPNGINWTLRTSAADNGWNTVAYGNGQYIAGSHINSMMSSTDGITWTSFTLPSLMLGSGWVTYGNGMFLAADSNQRVSGLGTTNSHFVPTTNNYQGGITLYGDAIFRSGVNGTSTFQIQNNAGSAGILFSSSNLGITYNAANATLKVGRDTGTGRSINAAGTINASGADFAEYFVQKVPGALQPGDVVCQLSDKKVQACDGTGGTLLGAVSTNPGYIGNDIFDPANPDNTVIVALLGQVPVKVSDANGSIQPGDHLTYSSQLGVAVKATGTGMSIGTAMEELTTSDGTIMVLVRPTWYSPPLGDILQGSSLNVSGDSILGGNVAIGGNLNVSGATTLTTLTVTGSVTIQQNLTVQGNTTIAGNLTVGGKIITSGATPVAVLGAASGIGASYTIEGNDTAGSITVVTGSSVNTGEQVVVSFASNFTASPRVSLTPATLAASTVDYYVTKDTTGFKLYFSSSPTPGQTYTFDYQILQ